MSKLPLITIVVCTYNRADKLSPAIHSLMDLETDKQFEYEILAVDNRSTDHTPEVLHVLAEQSPVPFHIVQEPQPGVSAARNRGIREAKGEWIAFFDDDQIAHPRWLLALLLIARKQEVRCAGGAVKLKLPTGCDRELAPMTQMLLGATPLLTREVEYDRKFSPGTGNVLLHRSVFDVIGSFDENLHDAGEDTELFRRMKGQNIAGWYTPEAIVEHIIPAERLQDEKLRWTALRIGGHLARRELDERGQFGFPLVFLARLALLLGRTGPKSLWQRFTSDPEIALGTRCRLWFEIGYARYGLALLSPRLFPQKRFFSGLNFRTRGPVAAS